MITIKTLGNELVCLSSNFRLSVESNMQENHFVTLSYDNHEISLMVSKEKAECYNVLGEIEGCLRRNQNSSHIFIDVEECIRWSSKI